MRKVVVNFMTLSTVIALLLMMTACSAHEAKNDESVSESTQEIIEESTEADNSESTLDFYIPQELSNNDFHDKTSQWCFSRSKSSRHFIVFWEEEFGENPNSDTLPDSMRVDVDDMLTKLESFYSFYRDELGFCREEPGRDSQLSHYKIEVYLLYQYEWLATGAGYDDVIGAMWVNPSTCQPTGAIIAHELGHCFQYQIYCDKLLNGEVEPGDESAFRYAYADGYGNTFWEQTAEWQALNIYPEFLEFYDENLWFSHCCRSMENEWDRYESVWFLFAIEDYFGPDAVSRIWSESQSGEDVLSCVLRVFFDGDIESFNEFLYYYASHCATFDFDSVPDSNLYISGDYSTDLFENDSGYLSVGYDSAPDIGGINVISLDDYLVDVSENQVLCCDFRALPVGAALAPGDIGLIRVDDAGDYSDYFVTNYNDGEYSGSHMYGFVAILEDGSREYVDGSEFEISGDISHLYFVVVGVVDDEVVPHVWDDDQLTDVQLPYELMFTISE